MVKVNEKYGWFEYLDNPKTIRNYKSGQKLTLIKESEETSEFENTQTFDAEISTLSRLLKIFGPVKSIAATPPPNKTIQREFLYKDEEIEQNIIVLFSYSEDKFKRLAIVVDYQASFSSSPTYGVWRRIDDFLVDALICWPEDVFTDRILGAVKTIGGWFQGKWVKDFNRRFHARKSYTAEQLEQQPKNIVDPYLVPLDIPIPKQWKYVDQENPETKALLNFNDDNEYKLPFISRDAELEGFQGRVPYLVREDGLAYIFIEELVPHSHRGEDPDTHVWYTYVDEHFFLTFRSCSSYGLELSTCRHYGFRELPPPKEFWATNIFGEYKDKSDVGPYSHSYMSYRVWRIVWNACMDAWPQWRHVVKNGMVRKIEIPDTTALPRNYGRHAYVGNYGPKMHGGYTAGVSNTWHTLLFDRQPFY